MDALGETGPFVMMGSMDNAFDRALAFALEYPDLVKAVVPVTLLVDEFQSWRDFYGKTNDEMVACVTPQIHYPDFDDRNAYICYFI